MRRRPKRVLTVRVNASVFDKIDDIALVSGRSRSFVANDLLSTAIRAIIQDELEIE